MARILIVDNAAFMRSSLKYIVEGAGHEVVGLASNGAEGVGLYRTLKPDLVTLDILMEKMDGIAALQLIRQQDPNAKVLMVTALGQEKMMDEARRFGASGYIRKPFRPEAIVEEINRVIGQKVEAGERRE